MRAKLKPYSSSIILILALLIGALVGIFFPDFSKKLQPIGQVFLNLLFVIIVPLVGIGVMSSVAKMTDLRKLGKILALVIILSVVMASIGALCMLFAAEIFDPAKDVIITLKEQAESADKMDFVAMLAADDFVGLLSKSNILALIIMSIIAGIAIGQSGDSGKRLANLLNDMNKVIMTLVSIIMKMAPIGLGCYFASTMANQDLAILSTFARAFLLYLIMAIIWYAVVSNIYSFLASGLPGVKLFWKNAIPPTATALGTCSSLSALPVTLRASRNMHLHPEIVDVSIPLLVNLNKAGTAMITALQIVFIHSILDLPFTTDIFFMALIVSVISAIIVGGVPGGAFLGEIFIVTSLGLPMETIPILVILVLITDSLATLINVIHDLCAAQMIERIVLKKSKG